VRHHYIARMANRTHGEPLAEVAAVHPVVEVARVFGRLGLTAFGGPAAHIAAMEDELVQRRAWVTRAEFMDLVSAANVIPGPNSTELALHLGLRRAGWRGLVAAGLAFVVPASVLVWMIAIAYVRYGRRPEMAAMLLGMQPVVLAVVGQALWRLGRSVLRAPLPIGIAIVGTVAVMAGLHELLVLAAAAAVGAASRGWTPASAARALLAAPIAPPIAPPRGGAVGRSAGRTLGGALVTASVGSSAPSAGGVFVSFFKIGSVLFGSGYVLLAFLRAEFVQRHGWLTDGQVLDAIAIGQVTPGPVFTSATFIGYLLAGHAGAGAATVGIFLPAFLFVAVSGPLVRRVRTSPRAAAALDGVNAASLALMVAVVLIMVKPVTTSWVGIGIFVVAGAALLRTTIGAGWMLLLGAVVGLVSAHLR
jgi:chromate transporter